MVLGLGLAACGGASPVTDGANEGAAGAGAGGSAGETAATGGTGSAGTPGAAGSGGSSNSSGGAPGAAGAGMGGSPIGMAGSAGSGPLPGSGGDGGTAGAPMGGAGAGGEGGMPIDPPDPAGVVGFAFAGLADSNAIYSPVANYSYNAGGGDISIERTGEGAYTVEFENLDPPMRSAQVTAYDHDGYCTVSSHSTDRASVRCYDNDGNLTNAAFSLAAFGPAETSASVVAYAYAGAPNAPQYGANANYSYNLAGASMTARRSAAGTYTLDFNGLSLTTGNVQVTALDSHHHCSVDGWSGNTVETTCYDDAGTPADTKYVVMVIKSSDSPAAILGYAYSTNSTDPSTDLTGGPSTFNATGGTVVSERSATGEYRVTFDGADFSASHPHVTSRTARKHCGVTQWGADWVRLSCWDDTGAASDSLFNVLVVE